MLLLLLACTQPHGGKPTVDAFVPTFDEVRDEGLTEDAAAAVTRMPAWLEPELRLALAQVDDERQDLLAATVLDLDEPDLLDEVGFAMAHLSKEVLKSDNFYPQLLVENAELIYEVDPQLAYVELVETGVPEVDADWTTTTAYQVETDGVVETITLDPELYYWYVVHPRIEDEHPWYIDAWEECDRASLECAAEPETGTFWRRFLWDEAAETCPEGESCPVVKDYLGGETLLYGSAKQDDAVHAVAGMMLDSPDGSRWLNFGAYGERSIQPNRIYALGRGNCGEWADMTSAIARTALIPNINVTPSSWDHTWSAFYLDRWVAYEPVNWWFDYGYGSSYATYATRGDTSIFYQTEQYNPNNGTLTVNVKDGDGEPVDGAVVVLWSPYDSSYWYAGEQVTGIEGEATFTVGADLEFMYSVTSDLGEDQGTFSGVAAGDSAEERVRLSGVMPLAPTTAEGEGSGGLTVSASLTSEGRVIAESYRFGDQSTQPSSAPELQTWLMSHADYEAWVDGGEPVVLSELDPVEGGVFVLANPATLGTAAIGELTLETGGDDIEPVTLTRPYALLAGEWIAIAID